jgi:hypothetical protein
MYDDFAVSQPITSVPLIVRNCPAKVKYFSLLHFFAHQAHGAHGANDKPQLFL